MATPLNHRGPDDAGNWIHRERAVAFAFRRLAIIDTSPAGAQPMVSATGRYVLVFNGEIYNFQRLRERLEKESAAPPWRGHSDTEVLLACVEAWGLERAIGELIGMFAFALWDQKARSLTLVRDRLGIKPLYWGTVGDTTLFGSQPKAITAHPAWRARR